MNIALLLDPSPFEIWVAVRSDLLKGSGTLNDPYDGSSQIKFDGIIGSLAVGSVVHLGPGTFQTGGYNGTSGWEIKAKVKIHGSGYDVTKLQIVSPASGALTVAIGHNLLNRADFCEITDLTIDRALPGTGTPACGAISVAGSHIRIQRVHAINFGTLSTSVRYVVISAGVARPNSTPTPTNTDYVDCVIEDCMLDTLAQTSVRETTCLEIGAAENPSTGEIWSNRHCVIRNCYLNCIFTSNVYPTSQFQGLSLKGCIGGVVEGNKILNCTIGGPYLDSFSNTDVIVRQNNYYNVVNGAWWNLGNWSSGGGSSSLAP